jgi:hypothetical protein
MPQVRASGRMVREHQEYLGLQIVSRKNQFDGGDDIP